MGHSHIRVQGHGEGDKLAVVDQHRIALIHALDLRGIGNHQTGHGRSEAADDSHRHLLPRGHITHRPQTAGLAVAALVDHNHRAEQANRQQIRNYHTRGVAGAKIVHIDRIGHCPAHIQIGNRRPFGHLQIGKLVGRRGGSGRVGTARVAGAGRDGSRVDQQTRRGGGSHHVNAHCLGNARTDDAQGTRNNPGRVATTGPCRGNAAHIRDTSGQGIG